MPGHVLRRRATVFGSCVAVVLGSWAATPAGGSSAAAPQGTIVFSSNRTGNFEIYSLRADGSQLGQLTRNGALDTAPLFSPDGRRILFTRGPDEYTSNLWVMNADGTGQRKLASPGYEAAWAPDSRRIVYRGSSPSVTSPLVITNVDGGGRHVVPGSNYYPSWSPDGQLIAFVRTVH